MTTEMYAAFVGAVVLLLTNLAGLAKVWTDNARTKADRLQTKEQRDQDSRELRDLILKHDFAICQLKDQQALTATCVDDLRDTCAALNTSVAKLDVNVANLADAIRGMRE